MGGWEYVGHLKVKMMSSGNRVLSSLEKRKEVNKRLWIKAATWWRRESLPGQLGAQGPDSYGENLHSLEERLQRIYFPEPGYCLSSQNEPHLQWTIHGHSWRLHASCRKLRNQWAVGALLDSSGSQSSMQASSDTEGSLTLLSGD